MKGERGLLGLVSTLGLLSAGWGEVPRFIPPALDQPAFTTDARVPPRETPFSADAEDPQLGRGLRRARTFMRNAIHNDSEISSTIRRMQRASREAFIGVEPFEGAIERCRRPHMLGFSKIGGSEIILCTRTLEDSREFVAQVLLHELAHAVGYRDECRTTEIERTIMYDSGHGPVMDNIHVEPCGLE